MVANKPESYGIYKADWVLGVFAALYLFYVLMYGIYVTLTFKNECSSNYLFIYFIYLYIYIYIENTMIPLDSEVQNQLAFLEYHPGQLNNSFAP